LAKSGTSEILSDILERAKQLDPSNTRSWFDQLRVARFSGGLLEVNCPDEATAQFLQDHCKSTFTRAAQQVTGHLVSVGFSIPTKTKRQTKTQPTRKVKLHPDYTFSSFALAGHHL